MRKSARPIGRPDGDTRLDSPIADRTRATRRRVLGVSLCMGPALAACGAAPQAAEPGSTATLTGRVVTAIPATPTAAPPTPTAIPTPTPAPEPEEWTATGWNGKVDILRRDPRLGSTLLVRVWSLQAQAVTTTYEGREQPLARLGNAFVGLFGVERLGRLGPRQLRFTLADGNRRVTRNNPEDAYRVVDAGYPVEELTVDAKTMALLDPIKMNQEDALLNGIMAKFTPERLWRGAFAEPMLSPAGPVPLSSDFGVKRSINGAPPTWSHEGTDYEVDTGDPIRVVADGKVVYTGELHVRGKVVVVDHGWGVMSGYFHMFQQQVQSGQDVKQGQQLGLVGSTGFVTGPHLHVEIRVRNVFVEPLEWFQRPPFDRPELAAL